MYCCYRFCCTIVTIFVVLLLPLLLHCDYRFCCISNFLLQKTFGIFSNYPILFEKWIEMFWIIHALQKRVRNKRH